MKQKRGGEKVSCVPAGSILIQLYLTGILFFISVLNIAKKRVKDAKKLCGRQVRTLVLCG